MTTNKNSRTAVSLPPAKDREVSLSYEAKEGFLSERKAHRALESHNLRSEWFDSETDVSIIGDVIN